MKLSEFSEFGFIHLSSFDEEIRYRFFSRQTLQVSSIDQDGRESSEEIVTLKHVDFSLLVRGSVTLLRVSEPSHSVRELLNSFEVHTGLGFYVVPLAFSFTSLKQLFVAEYSTEVLGVKVSELALSDSLLAKVELSSKKPLSLDEIDFLKGHRYQVDSADFVIRDSNVKSKISFSKTGLLKVSGELTTEVIKLVDRFAFHFFSVK